VHLVGFIIRIHHDARSSECQIRILHIRSLQNVGLHVYTITINNNLFPNLVKLNPFFGQKTPFLGNIYFESKRLFSTQFHN